MENEWVRIKATGDTRRNLKLLAAMLDKTMIEVLEIIVREALEKQQQNADPKSL